jgi:hypothetical protein
MQAVACGARPTPRHGGFSARAIVVLAGLALLLSSIGCGPVPLDDSRAPRLPSLTGIPGLEQLEKVGPELQRHLLERSRLVLQTPTSAEGQLPPVTVVIQARRDISPDLAQRGANIRSVTRDGTIIITADVPLPAIPGILALPGLEAIELAQPVPPADADHPAVEESSAP